MQTRRDFLKIIAGLGAGILPWTGLPWLFEDAIGRRLGKVPVQLLLSEAGEMEEGREENLHRSAMADIVALTSPEMQGREAGTTGETKAAAYLSKQLSTLGLKPLGDNGAGFTFAFTIPLVHKSFVNGRLTFLPGSSDPLRPPGENVIGSLTGNQEDVIILSAHFDHLGIYQNEVYPGANDNASGVACVLDVMRRLIREEKVLNHTVVAAFWSAEESGYNGSRAFLEHPTFPLEKLKAVFNVDTIGNGMVGNFILWGKDENAAVKVMEDAAEAAKCSAVFIPNSQHNSDQLSFAQAGIPAVTLLAREWLVKNHTPEDTIGMIKPEQIALASEVLYRAVCAMG